MNIHEQVTQLRVEEAREETREEFVRELLAGTEFSDEKIASLARVHLARVAAIREELRLQ